MWSADGTWTRLLQLVQAAADAAAEIDWDISVDSTVVRAHQHAAGARTEPPPVSAPKGAEAVVGLRQVAVTCGNADPATVGPANRRVGSRRSTLWPLPPVGETGGKVREQP
ncbi:hypothetical protein GCM10010094_24900 [Streptomyces flaveus]|uniref:Transposase n=1 Tax=Streptomyces flaveus TaxID=66370 RepID=A0A917QR47_9ACTN|nr:hypothetical protein GCM10010094_24900 [Streptomyces flaveus]